MAESVPVMHPRMQHVIAAGDCGNDVFVASGMMTDASVSSTSDVVSSLFAYSVVSSFMQLPIFGPFLCYGIRYYIKIVACRFVLAYALWRVFVI
jgi:hypothetical protein